MKMLTPEDLRDSFDIVDVKKENNTITITLEEQDLINNRKQVTSTKGTGLTRPSGLKTTRYVAARWF